MSQSPRRMPTHATWLPRPCVQRSSPMRCATASPPIAMSNAAVGSIYICQPIWLLIARNQVEVRPFALAMSIAVFMTDMPSRQRRRLFRAVPRVTRVSAMIAT